jgi:protease-4
MRLRRDRAKRLFVLRILFYPLLVLARLLLAPIRALKRLRAAPRGALIEVKLKGRVREGPPRPTKWWPPRFLAARGPFMRNAPEGRVSVLRRIVDEVIADDGVSGLIATVEGLEAGWATLEAIRAELLRVRTANKRLAVYLPSGAGNGEMFVASAAETIVAAPTVDIALVGIRSEGHYARAALDRIGVGVELHARKEFKSAGDRVARDDRSEGDRLQTTVLVEGVDGALIAAVAEGRGMTVAEVEAAIDEGPTHAKYALERKLVDRLAHDDELPTVLGAPIVLAGGWYARRKSGKTPRPLFPKPYIGVVEVHGGITSGSSPIAGAMGPVAIADRVIADLRAAERDPKCAAVVLDVDSPGGTVVASDAIGAAVKRLSAKKPVFARMGDVAASGGYWIACEARAIVARPLTVTGSIGVVAIRPIAARLAERIGISRDVIARGRFADLDALIRPPRDDERELFAREIDRHYEAFVDHVARARNKSSQEIEPLARGRVWLGKDALDKALVDHLGGFDLAVSLAREASGKTDLDPEARIIVGHMPSHRDAMPEAKRVLAALATLLPEELAPLVAAIESRASVVVLASNDRLR